MVELGENEWGGCICSLLKASSTRCKHSGNHKPNRCTAAVAVVPTKMIMNITRKYNTQNKIHPSGMLIGNWDWQTCFLGSTAETYNFRFLKGWKLDLNRGCSSDIARGLLSYYSAKYTSM